MDLPIFVQHVINTLTPFKDFRGYKNLLKVRDTLSPLNISECIKTG